jgi:hypothetical protein
MVGNYPRNRRERMKISWKTGLLVWLFIAACLLLLQWQAHGDGGFITIPLETYNQQSENFETLKLQFGACKMALADLLKYPGLLESLIEEYSKKTENKENLLLDSVQIVKEETENSQSLIKEEEEILNDVSTSLTSVKDNLTNSISDIEHSGRMQFLKEIGLFIGGVLLGAGGMALYNQFK